MSAMALSSIAMSRSLVKRFGVAMLIILTTTLGSFFAVHYQLQQSAEDGHLINLSGRQRMLSQRIALLTAELSTQQTTDRQADDRQAGARERLAQAIDLMAESHQELLADSLDTLSLADHMTGPEGLDRRVSDYLGLAQAALIDPTTDSARSLPAIAADVPRLLGPLDAYVAQLEANYEAKLATFKWAILSLAVLSVTTLLVIVWMIFKPAIRLVSTNVQRLEEANSELTQFSYRISHDLRSPVVASLGLTSVAQQALEDDDGETASGAIARVHSSLSRVASTIEDIVGLIKQRMTEVEPETFRVEEVVNHSIESIQGMPDVEKLTVEVDCPKDCEVRTKRVYLEQSIANLVSNAVKYRDPDIDDARVSVAVRIDGSECCVSIADNGLGIAEDYRPKMFKMFQRFHPGVAFGTGLGLYLVAKNAAALDGSIEYQPLPKGSRFDIHFPNLGA